MNIWSRRYLSAFGKIEVANTLAISRLVYASSMLPSPSDQYLKEVEKILTNFIWNNKTARADVLKNT